MRYIWRNNTFEMEEINLTAFYSIADIQLKGLSSLSEREMQRYSKNKKLKRIDRRYIFTGHQLKEMNDFYRKKADNKKLRQELREELRLKKIEEAKLKNAIQKVDISFQDAEIIKLRKENEELRKMLSEEIPHQQKLKEAIQLITLEAMEQNVMHKVFTDEEYNDIIGTIAEVEFQTKQVEYLKNRVEKQDEILSSLTRQIQQRNYIEAKDKGFDKE